MKYKILGAINFNIDELGVEKQPPDILFWLPYYFEVFRTIYGITKTEQMVVA